MSQRIVVLAGFAGSGKDTAGAVFTEHGFTRAPLAGPLKNMLRCFLQMRDYPEEIRERMLEGDLKEVETSAFGGCPGFNTPRRAMQLLGAEWGRVLDPLLWLDTWSIMHCQPGNYVVTDCRYANEAGYLRKQGAEVYLVKRPGFQRRMEHSSEDLSWAEGCEVIWNDFPTAGEFQDSIRARFFA